MRLISIFISITTLSLTVFTGAHGATLDDAKNRCGVTTAGEAIVYQNDFQNPAKHLGSTWWWTLPELDQKFTEIYASGKRLATRAYYDAATGQFLMPINKDSSAPPVVVPENFILSVRKHIEAALKNKYAEHIFFPDMGHSHFYFETAHWEKTYPALLNGPKSDLYSFMLADPNLRVLYHTAEKLLTTDENKVLLPDPHIQYRYWNRNIVGDNRQGDTLQVYVAEDKDKYNTINNIEGHSGWSAGFNVSASIDGCFPYEHNGTTYYFDLSLQDLEYDPSAQSPDDYF